MYDDYDDDYFDDDEGRSWGRIAAVVVGIVAVIGIGWFVIRPAVSDDGAQAPPVVVDESTTTAADEPSVTEPDTTDDTAVERTDDTTDAGDADVDEDAEATTTEAPETTSAPTTVAPTTAAPTTAAPTTAAPTTAVPTTAAPAGSVTYDTLPDGSPAPIEAVFAVDQITITGAVPSQEAKDRLQALAVANAKPGQADTVTNSVTINPDVPIGIGVRVVELTSVRFPESSADILPPHAAELDRAVGIMNALPNVTALVIGHADQRGDELTNYALSVERAEAVVNYMAAQGIAPSRMSSRAVGAADLLTLENDDVAFALNRRTEFVFYGLLVG